MGLTYEVAKFIAGKGFSDLPKEDIKVGKDLLLDALGVMIGGVRERVSQIAIGYVKDSGGVGECGVFGGGFRTSLSNAGLINGASAHAQELESLGMYTGSNPMTNIPVALSVAEKFKLSGKAVIEGIVIGLEVQTKLGMGGPGSFDRGFSSISLYGTLGAAATACQMMKLSIDQIRNAFGICVSQCSGLQRQFGTMTHLLETGIGCRNGVTAAMLAKEGMTADPDLIEGERGFYDLFCSGGRGYDTETVIRTIGNPFCLAKPGYFIKKYGCCFFNHWGIDALQQIMEENNISSDNVESVQVDIPAFMGKILRYPEPKCAEESKFSLQQSLGSILVDGKAELPYIRPFTDAGVANAKYREARKKINVVTREDWAGGRSASWSMPVTVKLKDGRNYTKAIDKLKGGPEDPLSKEELVARHRVLVQDFLSPEQTQRSIDLVYNIENLDNISELMELATFGKSG